MSTLRDFHRWGDGLRTTAAIFGAAALVIAACCVVGRGGDTRARSRR